MSYFDFIFGNKNQDLPAGWRTLSNSDELDRIINKSMEKPVAIYKHSTRCGVSSMVLRQLIKEWDIPVENLELYFLDLIAYRPISNEVARRFSVVHESPQIILVKDGEAVYDASHHLISVNELYQNMTGF